MSGIVIDLEARANLRRALKDSAAGLDKGLDRHEIRADAIKRSEMMIRTEAKRHVILTSSSVSTAIFLRMLAAELEHAS